MLGYSTLGSCKLQCLQNRLIIAKLISTGSRAKIGVVELELMGGDGEPDHLVACLIFACGMLMMVFVSHPPVLNVEFLRRRHQQLKNEKWVFKVDGLQ